jgi:hypothetical protein
MSSILGNSKDLFAIILTASGADTMGDNGGIAVGAESCLNAFVTVGSFALTTLHTGSFPFGYGHFIILLILT